MIATTGCQAAGNSADSINTESQQTEAGMQATSSFEVRCRTIGYLPITHALAAFEEKELLDQNPESASP